MLKASFRFYLVNHSDRIKFRQRTFFSYWKRTLTTFYDLTLSTNFCFLYSAKNKVDLSTSLRAFFEIFWFYLMWLDTNSKDAMHTKNDFKSFFRARKNFLNILDSLSTPTIHIIWPRNKKIKKSKVPQNGIGTRT